MDPLLPGSGLPMKGCEQDGPPVARRSQRPQTPRWTLRGATDLPGPRQSIAQKGRPARAQLPFRGSVWLSVRQASLPSRTFGLAVVATATWSGGPPAARWAAPGPSCTAAWKARCCGPGNSPSGRRGTVTGRKAQVLGMRGLKSDPSSSKPPFCRHHPTRLLVTQPPKENPT